MDKKIAGLIGAFSAFVALDAAQASAAGVTQPIPSAQSYSDLLQPIPNAVALLAVSDAAVAANSNDDTAKGNVLEVDYRHHHHHRRRHYHHHHHHHHNY